jgi:PadR family transcriptional regulator AphA
MTAARLSTTSYVVLGMIALRGPSTPYDLKRAVAGSVGYFWHFPHAQLYAEPDRLAALGLLELSAEGCGRRRKTYSLTGPGHSTLRAWLAAPTHEHFQLRDVAELKLFFSGAGELADVPELAREQTKRHEERIAVYESLLEGSDGPAGAAAPAVVSGGTGCAGTTDGAGTVGDDRHTRSQLLALELGLEMEHAARRFWAALADDDLDRLRRERNGLPGGR